MKYVFGLLAVIIAGGAMIEYLPFYVSAPIALLAVYLAWPKERRN